jgi:hypothetical protein
MASGDCVSRRCVCLDVSPVASATSLAATCQDIGRDWACAAICGARHYATACSSVCACALSLLWPLHSDRPYFLFCDAELWPLSFA